VPDAILVATADAVTRVLNDAPAGAFSQKFEAVRSYADWELPLEESSPLDGRVLVDVVPVSTPAMALETPVSISYQVQVDVVVRKRLGPDSRDASGRYLLASIDPLVLLVEQINERFTPVRFATPDNVSWDAETGNRILAAYKPSHLREHHQFTGIVRLGFKAHKEVR
jgi:hypothetical protein